MEFDCTVMGGIVLHIGVRKCRSVFLNVKIHDSFFTVITLLVYTDKTHGIGAGDVQIRLIGKRGAVKLNVAFARSVQHLYHYHITVRIID